MSTEKIIILEDIGEVSLRKDRRFKRLSIRMAPTKGIWINLPYGISYKEAIQFAKENQAWIVKNKHKKELQEKKQTIFTSSTDFKTKYHQLRIFPQRVNFYSSKLSSGILEVVYPEQMNIESNDLQEFIRYSVIETLRREANYYLPKRLELLAQEHGFKYKSMRIKNTKSRWGSCSHDNKINLSLHLVRLPEDLSDMVILHELCHTIIKNHSKEFWDLLAKHCPNLKYKKQQIKQYSISIL